MSDVDAAKLRVMLNALRLPTMIGSGRTSAPRPTARAGAAHVSSPRCATTSWPSARPGASPVIWRIRPAARQDLRHPRLRRRPHHRKAHVMALAEGDAWIEQGGNLLIFGPSGTGKTHLVPPSAPLWSTMASGCSSPAPPTSCRSSRGYGAISHCREPWPSSTASTCSFSMTSATCARTRPKPMSCSS